jgi:hypothetical protein
MDLDAAKSLKRPVAADHLLELLQHVFQILAVYGMGHGFSSLMIVNESVIPLRGRN